MFVLYVHRLDGIPGFRAVLGFGLVFLLPGLAWSLVFFKQINIMERIALSFGISVALVTLSIITLDVLLDVDITGLNSLLVILVVSAVPFGIYYLRQWSKK